MRKLMLSVLGGTILMLLYVAVPAWSAGGPPPPPPPPGAGTPVNTPVFTPPCVPSGCPTSTPTITPTPSITPVPLTVSAILAHGTVAPRTKQKITAITAPGVTVKFTVKFPNGDSKKHTGTANSSGRTSWSYNQPGSRITHASRRANITVNVTDGTQTATAHKHYTIGFAPVDVVVQPRKAKRGQSVSVWIHAGPRERVWAILIFKGNATARVGGRTSPDGWFYSAYAVPANAARGKVEVKGVGLAGNSEQRGETSFTVR